MGIASVLMVALPVPAPAQAAVDCSAFKGAASSVASIGQGMCEVTFVYGGSGDSTSYTWSKPANVAFFDVLLVGGGGGGAGGTYVQGAATQQDLFFGGGGGGGGRVVVLRLTSSQLPDSLPFTVGRGGVGSAGGSNNSGASGVETTLGPASAAGGAGGGKVNLQTPKDIQGGQSGFTTDDGTTPASAQYDGGTGIVYTSYTGAVGAGGIQYPGPGGAGAGTTSAAVAGGAGFGPVCGTPTPPLSINVQENNAAQWKVKAGDGGDGYTPVLGLFAGNTTTYGGAGGGGFAYTSCRSFGGKGGGAPGFAVNFQDLNATPTPGEAGLGGGGGGGSANRQWNGDSPSTYTYGRTGGGAGGAGIAKVRFQPATAPQLTGYSPPTGVTGTSYSYSFTATGSPTPTISASGTLPPGLTLNGGTLSGLPEAGGSYPFTVTATNGISPDDSKQVTVLITAPGFAANPTELAFGRVDPGATSTRSLVVTNTGDADLVISSVTLTGTGAAQFELGAGAQNTCVATVAPQATCSVGVTFTAPSGSAVASVEFSTNLPTAVQSVALTGTGEAAPTPPGPGPTPPGPGPEPSSSPTPTPTPTPTSAPGSTSDPLGPVTGNPNLPAGGLPPGGSLLLVDGVPAPLTVVPNARSKPTGLDISGGGWKMRLVGRGDDGDPLGLTEKQVLILQSDMVVNRERAKRLKVNPVAQASGDGFKAVSPVKFYLLDNDAYLGSLTTDAAGVFSGRIPVPAGIKPGPYTLQMNGLAPNDAVRSLNIGVIIKPTTVKTRTFTASTKVYFASLDPRLDGEARSTLRALVKKTGPSGVRVQVVGYVQPRGASSNDQSLSTARARNVEAFLRDLGLRGAYVTRGDGRAQETGATARRVNITVTYTR